MTSSVIPGRDLRIASDRNLLVFVLQLIKLVVNTALGKQLLVRPHFAHLAFVHHDDLVRSLNG